MPRNLRLLISFIVLFLFISCNIFNNQLQNLMDEVGLQDQPSAQPFIYTETPNNPINGFGMGSSTNIRVADIDAAYADMRSFGVQFVREEFPMELIQKGPGNYDFGVGEGFDRMIEAANRNNLKIVALLAYGPSVPYRDDDEFLELWEEYVRMVVVRYGSDIDYWEIGNEMNSLLFWRKVRRDASEVEPKIYASMLERAYRVIKEADPNDTVIVGGLINDADFSGGYSPLSFIIEVGKYTGSKPVFDAVGLHTYWGSSMPETERSQLVTSDYKTFSMHDYVKNFADDVARWAGREIPIWITEVGYDDAWLAELSDQYRVPFEDIQALVVARSNTV